MITFSHRIGLPLYKLLYMHLTRSFKIYLTGQKVPYFCSKITLDNIAYLISFHISLLGSWFLANIENVKLRKLFSTLLGVTTQFYMYGRGK